MFMLKDGNFSKRFVNRARSCFALALAGICIFVWSGPAIAAISTTIFKTKKNGKTIVCGLLNGKYVPGAGSAAKFTSTAESLAKLKGKTDAKSKAKVRSLKDYQKLAAAVCRKGPPSTGGNAATGQQIFNTKCLGCHADPARFKGMSATQLKAIPAYMGTLTTQEAADLAAYLK